MPEMHDNPTSDIALISHDTWFGKYEPVTEGKHMHPVASISMMVTSKLVELL